MWDMKQITYSLTDHEPIIDFILRPSSKFAETLEGLGKPVPKPVKVRGLVDTGFSGGLFIDQSLVKGWGLITRNFNQVSSLRPDDGRIYHTYAWEVTVSIKFESEASDVQNILIDPIPATLVEFADIKQTAALIGREILQATTFLYDGTKQSFTIGFSDSFVV